MPRTSDPHVASGQQLEVAKATQFTRQPCAQAHADLYARALGVKPAVATGRCAVDYE